MNKKKTIFFLNFFLIEKNDFFESTKINTYEKGDEKISLKNFKANNLVNTKNTPNKLRKKCFFLNKF